MYQKAKFLLAFSQLLTLLVCSISAESRESDSLVLVAFQNANQSSNLSWNMETAMDSWEGVTLNGDGRVSELSLEFMSLTTVPAEIGGLNQLTRLKLRYNKIETLAKEIGNLSVLEYLNLSANKLETIPDEIGQLSNLIELNLNSNQLTQITPSVGKLSSLENFYISGNSALQVLPENIGDLSNLKKIIVTKTAITAIPESFGSLSNLEYINFEENALETITESIEHVVPKSFDGKFVYVNFGTNFLKRASLPIPVVEWLDRYAGDWEGSQQAVTIANTLTSSSCLNTVTYSVRENSVHFSALPEDEVEMILYGIDGREMHSEPIRNGVVTLPVSRGFYVMKIKTKVSEDIIPLSL